VGVKFKNPSGTHAERSMENSVNHLLAEAAKLQARGRIDDAATCCQQALAVAPSMAPAWFQLMLLRPGRKVRLLRAP
jgi:hypothetical protein